jgi:hypothetical protein
MSCEVTSVVRLTEQLQQRYLDFKCH